MSLSVRPPSVCVHISRTTRPVLIKLQYVIYFQFCDCSHVVYNGPECGVMLPQQHRGIVLYDLRDNDCGLSQMTAGARTRGVHCVRVPGWSVQCTIDLLTDAVINLLLNFFKVDVFHVKYCGL